MALRFRFQIAIALCAGAAAVAVGALALYEETQLSAARSLLADLARLQLGGSTREVALLKQKYSRYLIRDDDGQAGRTHFRVSNEPLHHLHIAPITWFDGAVLLTDGRITYVEADLTRATQSYVAAAIVMFGEHSRACSECYCVGGSIGQPFIPIRVRPCATAEEKRHAFALNMRWLVSIRGEPEVCDLAPAAWQDWNHHSATAERALLHASYNCP
jgi:hypothetical protein